MPSQEDYLDNLLRDVAEEYERQENAEASDISDLSVGESGASDSGAGDLGISDPSISDYGTGDAGMSDSAIGDLDISDLGAGDLGIPEYDAGDLGMSDLEAGDPGMSDPAMDDLDISDLGAGDSGMSDSAMDDLDISDLEAGDSDIPEYDAGDLGMSEYDTADSGISDPSMDDLDISDLEAGDSDIPEYDAGDLGMSEYDTGDSGISDLTMDDLDISELEAEDSDIPEYDAGDLGIPEYDTGDPGISDLAMDDLDISDLDAADSDIMDPDAGAPDLDAVTGMSEAEIESLLAAGSGGEDADLSTVSDMDIPDEDVLKMLEESDDEGLQDIQELLQKSDHNEAVDDSITALMEDYPEGEEDSRALEERILGGDKKADKEEKKRLAQEKKELARQKREKKKEEAAAKKAEKQAARAGKKAAKPGKQKDSRNRPETGEADTAEAGEQDMFDPSVLDSIVSAAGSAGDKQEQSGGEPAARSGAEDGGEQSHGLPDLDGLDLGDLFGDGGDDSVLGGSTGDGNADFPDFLAEDGIDLADLDDGGILREKEEPKQKQGFFARIMSFLTEEDEEEENENIRLSQENQDILNDLDKEEKGSKGKKGKKGKGKGKDKDKDKEKDGEKIKEKPKKKKEPKPKKEKPPKEPDNTPPGKRLTLKKMLPVLLVGLSVGVLLFVFVNSVVDYSDKKAAKTAYYEGDYQTCYQNLFGKDLNETESIMYGKSESILYIRLWIREYELFMSEGDRVKALDSLIQTVDDYPGLYAYAGQWNAEPEIAAGYATILNYLANEFGLTEAQAQEIAAERSDREYTRMVTAIAGGRTFENWNSPAVPAEPSAEPELPAGEEQLPDPLPEESELGGDTFIDNQ